MKDENRKLKKSNLTLKEKEIKHETKLKDIGKNYGDIEEQQLN
jgi:hypothetical protein